MDAWRNLDGTYRVRGDGWIRPYRDRRPVVEAVGRPDIPTWGWIVPESALGRLGIVHRVFVVIAAGYCCGPAARALARDYDLRRGKLFRVSCGLCGRRPEVGTLWEVPIVEVCGEGEEGQRTYEAAFRDAIEGR